MAEGGEEIQGLGKESIARVVAHYEAEPILVGEETKLAATVASNFFNYLTEKGARPVRDSRYDELKFAREVEGAVFNQKLSPVGERIALSEGAMLYGLLFGGVFDELYGEYCSKAGSASLSPGKETEIKTELVSAILDRARAKNKEAEMVGYGVTMGIEIEFSDRLRRAIMSGQPGVGKVIRQEDPAMLINTMTTYPVGLVGPIRAGIINTKPELTCSEVYTNPAVSPRTMLRELVCITKAGGLAGDWGVHETFGGVELTPEHTEIMDGLLISWGADLFHSDKLTRGTAASLFVGDGRVGSPQDKYKKISWPRGHPYYFPFFRRRDPYDINSYPKKDTNVFDEADRTAAVEMRAIPTFRQGEFRRFVRQATFQYLFAQGVRAVQKDEAKRTGIDQRLVALHGELMIGWNDLLRRNNMENVDDQGRFLPYSAAEIKFQHWDQRVAEIPFMKLRDKVVVASQFAPGFRSETRRLIRKYSRGVKEAIGY